MNEASVAASVDRMIIGNDDFHHLISGYTRHAFLLTVAKSEDLSLTSIVYGVIGSSHYRLKLRLVSRDRARLCTVGVIDKVTLEVNSDRLHGALFLEAYHSKHLPIYIFRRAIELLDDCQLSQLLGLLVQFPCF